MRKLLLIGALSLSACHGTSPQGGIEISEARFHPPLPSQTIGVGFLTFENKGVKDRLLSVSSPVSDRIELHNHQNVGGVMRMRKVDAIELPKGGQVKLESGSYHIMIFNADMELGEETTLTLDFETAEDVTIVVPIVKRGESSHCLLYTSPSPRDRQKSRMPSSA